MDYEPIDDICKRFIVYMEHATIIYLSFIAYAFNIFIKVFI